ncbi:MAG: rhodanese-like domain-containing protein [Patescibacteria group bacterium]
MHKHFLLLCAICVAIASPTLARAIPPPDFLFQFGSQFVQFFSLFFVFAAAVASVTLRWSQVLFYKIRIHKKIALLCAVLVVGLSLGGAYLVSSMLRTTAEQDYSNQVANAIDDRIAQYDVLSTDEKTPEPLVITDPGVAFISQYYSNLSAGEVATAYAVSKQNVTFDVYEGWYENVTSIEVESVEHISDLGYSAAIKIFEGNTVTRCAVLFELSAIEEPIRIIDSTVKVLSMEYVTSDIEQTTTSGNYLSDHPTLSLAISNEEFATKNVSNTYILDAREDEEYDIGQFPGSTHIRFADLLAGSWVELPTDKEIDVICWSGMRGEKVAEFLRSKGLAARYLEDGADGWVAYGGTWSGEIAFSHVYSESRYSTVFSTADVKDFVSEGVVLIDARDPAVYAKKHIDGSINISAFATPTFQFDALFAQVPAHSTTITICDDYLSCFDAKIVGIKLEKYGHTFLGRYTAPYEY